MHLLTFLRVSCFVSVALGAAIQPDSITDIVARLDQPEEPWLNKGCPNPLTQTENKNFTCPPKKGFELKENHYCKGKPEAPYNCNVYCERNLLWHYGKEIPFDSSRCGKGSECRLDEGMTVQVAESTTVGAPFIGFSGAVFQAGASFTWSKSKSTSNLIARTKPQDRLNDCGYWTFVPYMVKSCGVNSKGEKKQNPGSQWCKDRKDKEICVETPFQTATGKAGGATVFVATDCSSNKPLAFCKQDPVYLKAGVASDPQVHLDYKKAWKNGDESHILDTAKVQCEKGNWPMH
ncbi:hypothetical protein F4779DRAFT_601987 [Xylariaceae sp. FL0662B]|nr:hypothetical protein F4779DRAFT_601987 [Xylariaceae sp. FL0662B]